MTSIIHFVIVLLSLIVLLLLIAYAIGFWLHARMRQSTPPSIPLDGMLVMVFEVRRWQICRNWLFSYGPPVVLIVPEGFRFDGASIPRPFWALLSPTGLLLIPGLIHDYGYRYDQLWKVDRNGRISPWQAHAGKEFWDRTFLQVGRKVNGFALIDKIAWLALKIAGQRAWDANRRRHEEIRQPELSDAEREIVRRKWEEIDRALGAG